MGNVKGGRVDGKGRKTLWGRNIEMYEELLAKAGRTPGRKIVGNRPMKHRWRDV